MVVFYWLTGIAHCAATYLDVNTVVAVIIVIVTLLVLVVSVLFEPRAA